MDNAGNVELSIKDYALQRSKTVQAVYQQLKSKENLAALEGHVTVKRVGNKDVKFLDQKAIEILDKASTSAPVVYLQEDLKQELDETKDKLQFVERQAIFAEGQIQVLKDLLADKERELRALAEPQLRIDALEAQNAALSAENEAEKAKTLEAEKNAQKASEALTEALGELGVIEGKWWYKLFTGKK